MTNTPTVFTADFDAPGDPWAIVIGRKAAHRTHDGTLMVGTLERPEGCNPRSAYLPVIRFADGRWARADTFVTLID